MQFRALLKYKPDSKMSMILRAVQEDRFRLLASLLLLIAGYLFIAVFLVVLLEHDFFRSDVASYWRNSFEWQTPFHAYHVPGYPWMIALARALTFGQVSAIPLMMAINLVAFSACVFLIYRIALYSGLSIKLTAFAAVLFIVWPFVGLVYSVQPLADIPAMALFLAGLYLLLSEKRLGAGIFLGMAILTHKAMWVFAGLVLLASVFKQKQPGIISRFVPIGIAALPVGLLWVSGAFYHGSPWWLFENNLSVEMASQSGLPLLDGLLGTWLQDGYKGIVKGVIIAGFAIAAAAFLVWSIRLKFPESSYATAVSAGSMLLFMVLNQSEIWAAIRFSRLLVLPMIWLLACYHPPQFVRWFKPSLVGVLFLLLFGSQLAYAWYMVSFFAASE